MVWTAIRDGLSRVGLNVTGVADGRAYDGWVPGCRSAVVVASGGPALWDAFVDACRRAPETFADESDPLDLFVRRAVAAVDPPSTSRVWAFADFAQQPPVDMQRLALEAGLGWRSTLGLILHPTYGPWMGLRAVCFTTEDLPVDGPRTLPSPCEDCPAPCVTACPGLALADGAMDWASCTLHRAESADCHRQCHSRGACPHGAEHRYDPVQSLYHHDWERGRPGLAAAIGVEDRVGVEPVDWAERAARARRHLAAKDR